MKIIAAICLAVLATAANAVPLCSPNETEGYENCKTGFQVGGSGSDALWCASETDCVRVFPPASMSPPEAEQQLEQQEKTTTTTVDAIQEAAVSAGSSVTVSAALLAASAVAVLLC